MEYSISSEDLRIRLKTSAGLLLFYYMKLSCHKLGRLLFLYIQKKNWRKPTDKPKSLTQDIEQLFLEIKSIHQEIKEAFDDREHSYNATEEKEKSIIIDLSNINLNSNINNSVNINRNPGGPSAKPKSKSTTGKPTHGASKANKAMNQIIFSKNFLISEIIKTTLKSFIENVRLSVFGKGGFQQFQVDTYYLQQTILRNILGVGQFSGNTGPGGALSRPPTKADSGANSIANIINALFEEILSSLNDRCFDKNPQLDQTGIFTICEPKLKALN